MKKTLSIAALLVAGALLAGCAPAEAPAREAHGGISKSVGETAAREAHDAFEKASAAGKKASEVAREAQENIAKTSTIENVDVVEYALPEGPSLIVTVHMSSDDDVSADVVRQALAESLAQATSAPSQVGLVFVHAEGIANSEAGAVEVLPGVNFMSGGPVFTGDQARAIVG